MYVQLTDIFNGESSLLLTIIDVEYMRGYYDREKLSSVAIYPVIYWSIRSSSMRVRDGVKGIKWGIIVLSRCVRFTLIENIKLWCNLQVIISPFSIYISDLLFCRCFKESGHSRHNIAISTV